MHENSKIWKGQVCALQIWAAIFQFLCPINWSPETHHIHQLRRWSSRLAPRLSPAPDVTILFLITLISRSLSHFLIRKLHLGICRLNYCFLWYCIALTWPPGSLQLLVCFFTRAGLYQTVDTGGVVQRTIFKSVNILKTESPLKMHQYTYSVKLAEIPDCCPSCSSLR